MNTIRDYIIKARKETNTSSHQLSDSELLYFLNRRRNELANELITKVNEDFFYDIFSTDLIAGQNEYSLQICSAEQEGMKKIISLEVQWKDGENSVLLPKKSANGMGMTMDELGRIPISGAFFDIKDGSIFIYPTPEHNVDNGIKGQMIASIKDLKLTDNEEAIFPGHSDLREFYELIYIGAKIDCWDNKQEFEKKNLALADYDQKKKQMLSFLTNRYNAPSAFQTPNGNYFKY